MYLGHVRHIGLERGRFLGEDRQCLVLQERKRRNHRWLGAAYMRCTHAA